MTEKGPFEDRVRSFLMDYKALISIWLACFGCVISPVIGVIGLVAFLYVLFEPVGNGA